MPNTEAESVDDIVAASRSDGRNAKWILAHSMPDSHRMNRPVMSAVSSTPAVERTRPGMITGLIEESLVPRPPEKSMIQSATMPMNCAVCMSLNWIPRPSVPKAMPTRRNINSNGSPKR
jgi:hypothetical protein